MERLSEALKESEPENAARLSRGLSVLRGRLVQDALRASLDALAAGRYPEAVERQTEAVAAMEELLEALRKAAEKPGASSEESARRARALLDQIERLV